MILNTSIYDELMMIMMQYEDDGDINDDDDDDEAQIATWLKSYLTPLITTFTAPAPPPLPNWDKHTSIAKQTKLV